MTKLEVIRNPLSNECITTSFDILNSYPYFLQHTEGKEIITRSQIIKETQEYVTLGAKFYYIN